MKVTTKLDQKAVTSVNLAQSAIASMWLQIRSPVIDWKEAKVMGTHAHYHQRFLIEPCHIKFNITTMNRDGNLPSAHNPLLSYVHTYRPYTEAQHSPASIYVPHSLANHHSLQFSFHHHFLFICHLHWFGNNTAKQSLHSRPHIPPLFVNKSPCHVLDVHYH